MSNRKSNKNNWSRIRVRILEGRILGDYKTGNNIKELIEFAWRKKCKTYRSDTSLNKKESCLIHGLASIKISRRFNFSALAGLYMELSYSDFSTGCGSGESREKNRIQNRPSRKTGFERKKKPWSGSDPIISHLTFVFRYKVNSIVDRILTSANIWSATRGKKKV